jgi:hypothetical protein
MAGYIKDWAEKAITDHLIEKHSITVSERDIRIHWEELKKKANNKSLGQALFQLKKNTALRELYKVIINKITEQKINLSDQEKTDRVFDEFKNKLKEALPGYDENQLKVMFSSYVSMFKNPDDVDKYFDSLPGSWDEMLAGSREGIIRDIKINKLKEIILFENIQKGDNNIFRNFTPDKEPGKKHGKDNIFEFMQGNTEYFFNRKIYEELKKNLIISDPKFKKVFDKNLREPAPDLFIEKPASPSPQKPAPK